MKFSVNATKRLKEVKRGRQAHIFKINFDLKIEFIIEIIERFLHASRINLHNYA